jgi:PEP-CTERM motif
MKMRLASLSLLTICCLLLAVAPAVADVPLYNNGATNGNITAWSFDFGFTVSDSFTVPTGSDIETMSFVYWDASTSDILNQVDVNIGSTSFGSGGPGTVGASGIVNNFLGFNSFGYALYQADLTFASQAWSGDGWVTLANACTTQSGCTFSGIQVYWDENLGPSTAYENTLGSIGSESFTLNGTTGTGTTPEPSSIMLFGSGILGLAGVLRRKLTR